MKRGKLQASGSYVKAGSPVGCAGTSVCAATLSVTLRGLCAYILIEHHSSRPDICFCFRSEDWYKDHPNFKVLYHDADGDGKKDFGDRRIFDQVNVNRKRK
jgi:hypothetical protein